MIDVVVDFNLISLTFVLITILVLICAPKITYGINILFLWRTFAGSFAEEQNHFYLVLLNIFSAFQINNNYADSQAYKNHKFLSCLKVCLCCFFEDLDRTCSNECYLLYLMFIMPSIMLLERKKEIVAYLKLGQIFCNIKLVFLFTWHLFSTIKISASGMNSSRTSTL